jgi:hypothetical protein
MYVRWCSGPATSCPDAACWSLTGRRMAGLPSRRLIWFAVEVARGRRSPCDCSAVTFARFSVTATTLSGTVTGVWRDDAIEVGSVAAGPGPSLGPARRLSTPPCAPPVGGWPRGPVDENLRFDVGELLTSGAAVCVGTFRPGRDQAVLVAALTDICAVESALRPQLDWRLCIVQSRWTRAQVDAVKQVFLERRRVRMADAVGHGMGIKASPRSTRCSSA